MDSKAIFTKTYEVNTFTANSSKRLGLIGLGGILQDSAAYHAQTMGFGYEDMLELGSFWVLTKQSIKMKEWPKIFEELEVRTWTREPQKFNAFRDFELYSKGKLIGTCSTTWVNLDIKSRRPALIPVDKLPIVFLQEAGLEYEAKKIIISKDDRQMEFRKSFSARNSDLDLNRHVNNTKFSQWVLDSIPYELHDQHMIEEYHINFLSEVRLAEEISVYKDLDSSGENTHVFLGRKKGLERPCFIVEIKASQR